MKFDKNYDFPEGTVETDLNVTQKLDQTWPDLRRVVVVKFESGKEENIGGMTLVNREEGVAPQEDPEEVVDALYRIGFMKSSELGRSIQCRVKFFTQGRTPPISAVFSVISPELTVGREAQDDETAQALAGQEGAYGAIALATLRSQQVHINATQRILDMQQNLIIDANNRLDNAQNRESALSQMLLDAHMRDLGREDKVYNTLDNALNATIENARMFGEIHRREMTMDLELERSRLKADGTTAFIKEIGGQLSQAVPLLMMAGMAKFTDADPAAVMAMMGGAAGGGPPVQGPPPSPPPRSRPVGPGKPPATRAPVGRPAPTTTVRPQPPQPTVTQAPTTGVPLQPGDGVGKMSAAVGASMTAMQWSQFGSLLTVEEVQRLRDWLTSTAQSDQEAIGAMLRCVQVQKIANALSQVATNEQGMMLDQLLNQVYASMGVTRPTTSESVIAPASDSESQTVPAGQVVVLDAQSNHARPASGSNGVSVDSQSSTGSADSGSNEVSADSQSGSRGEDSEANTDSESSQGDADSEANADSESDGNGEDSESDEEAMDAESDSGSATSKSKAKKKASKSKAKKKASKSRPSRARASRSRA